MMDILQKIYNEMWNGTDTSLLIWVFVGFIVIVFISRRIAKIAEFKDRTKLLLATDAVIFPIMIFLFYIISLQIQEESAFDLSVSLFLVCGSWFVNRLIVIFFWNKKFIEKSGTKAPKLLQNFFGLIIYLLTISFVLGFIFDKPITSILVSTGVFATIIGFAMKDFLADIINGISLSIERPYSIGDWIELENGTYLGKVIDIKWRTTRLLSRNNSMIVVPNNRCGNMIVHNHSRPDKIYSCNYLISINSTLPPDLVKRQLILGMQDAKNIVRDPAPRAYLADATSEPFRYNIRVWWKNYEFSYFGRDNLFINVSKSLSKVGISQTAVDWQVSKRGVMDEIQIENVTKYDQVQKVDIFNDFSENEINLLLSNSITAEYEPNQNIVKQGDEGSSLFVILSGNARVILNKEGKDIKLGLLSNGDAFGEFSLLTGDKRSATVKAINHLECIKIPKDALKSIIDKNSNIIDSLASIMAERQKLNEEVNEKHKKMTPKEIFDYYKDQFRDRIKVFFN